jgi:TRAP-type mannitol/chloroaromatic compound transport system permease small subunit
MRTYLRVVDTCNEWMGQAAKWLLLVLVGVVFIDICARYVFSYGVPWAYETAQMMGASINALGWGYVRLHRSHIRIDVIYNKFPLRGRVLFDVVMTFVLFFPVFFIFLRTASNWAIFAWVENESMTMSHWYPPAAPMRTVIVIGLILLFLQFVSETIKDIYFLKFGRRPHEQEIVEAEI